MITNIIHINNILRDYDITPLPVFNMYGFFDSTNEYTRDMNSSQYTPANFNVYTATARQWAHAFESRMFLLSIPNYNMINATNMSNTFHGCSSLESIPNIPNSVIDMSYTFSGCSDLTGSIPNIPNSVTNMQGTFRQCRKLTGSIPNIPNGVTDMRGTFDACRNLTGSIPNIPNSVTNMFGTFISCSNLTGSIPNIPNSVTNMYCTFISCSNLTGSIPNIPNNVTNMSGTFSNCPKLGGGNVYIYSNNITNANDCFNGRNTSTKLNIYCHTGSQTYNSFNSYLGGTSNASLNIQLKTF